MIVVDPSKWLTEHLPGLKPFDPYDPDYLYDPQGRQRWDAEQMSELMWNTELHLPGQMDGMRLLCPTWGKVVTLRNQKFFIGCSQVCALGRHSNTAEEHAQMMVDVEAGRQPTALRYAKPVFACDHCARQDEVHPAGIFLMPHGFYLCKRCFYAAERKKFNYGQELIRQCHHCIKEEVDRLLKINPGLFVDLMAKPKG
jgi:hypothetical protein